MKSLKLIRSISALGFLTVLFIHPAAQASQHSLTGEMAGGFLSILKVIGANLQRGRDGYSFSSGRIRCTIGAAVPVGPGNICTFSVGSGKVAALAGPGVVRIFNMLKAAGAKVLQGREGQAVQVKTVHTTYSASVAPGADNYSGSVEY